VEEALAGEVGAGLGGVGVGEVEGEVEGVGEGGAGGIEWRRCVRNAAGGKEQNAEARGWFGAAPACCRRLIGPDAGAQQRSTVRSYIKSVTLGVRRNQWCTLALGLDSVRRSEAGYRVPSNASTASACPTGPLVPRSLVLCKRRLTTKLARTSQVDSTSRND